MEGEVQREQAQSLPQIKEVSHYDQRGHGVSYKQLRRAAEIPLW